MYPFLAIPDTIGKIHRFVRHAILNVKNVHCVMQKVDAAMHVNISVKMLNRKLTMVQIKDGGHGSIVDSVFRMYFYKN